MTSISALMINENTQQKETVRHNIADGRPRTVVRIQSPRASDFVTIDSDMVMDTDVPNDANVTQELIPDDTPPEQLGLQDSQPNTDNTAGSRSTDEQEKSDDEDEIDDDDDDEQTEGGSASRKKKGQRFFCTGYPPCSLSFTRSEHLARHIRKHTGERPFQCHCNRRFSRLDNLRQHAQTVHVNEEIPGDSLAATGTRYQRQIRTDRVRPAPRPRTNTMSSSGGHSRGHSRNLSTSSIGSTSSVFSNATDVRRRPPPLLMAGDNRPSTPPTYSHYAAQSPGDLSTPTSSTFPATPGSPNFSSTIGSPNSTTSRPYGEIRTPARRLSVPATYNPYYPYANPASSAYGPGPAVPSGGGVSIVTSPTSSGFPQNHGTTFNTADDWRRRTWHPSTYPNLNVSYSRPATSSLTYSQTPDAPQPAYAHGAMSATGQAHRLPGIESFDHVQHRPTTPPRRNLSPPQTGMNVGQRLLAAPDIEGTRRGHSPHASWDGSKRSLYPEIDDNGRPQTSWGRQTVDQADHFRARQPIQHVPSPMMGPPPPGMNHQKPQQIAQEALHLESSASKRVKRSGHYSGSGPVHRTSPDSSSSDGAPTPGTSAAEISPAIMNSNGFIEPQLLAGDSQHTPCLAPGMTGPPTHEVRYIPNSPRHVPHQRRASELDRLEALVAVATSDRVR